MHLNHSCGLMGSSSAMALCEPSIISVAFILKKNADKESLSYITATINCYELTFFRLIIVFKFAQFIFSSYNLFHILQINDENIFDVLVNKCFFKKRFS